MGGRVAKCPTCTRHCRRSFACKCEACWARNNDSIADLQIRQHGGIFAEVCGCLQTFEIQGMQNSDP